MTCPKCGAVLQGHDKFCTECGAPIDAGAETAQQTSEAASAPAAGASAGKVGFGTAIKLFFVNYAKFTGRSSRSEFWWAFLFTFIINSAFNIIGVEVLTALWGLAILVPDLAITIRREHDIGRRWTRILLGLIPLVGWIILIVDCATPSVGDNQWGSANAN